MANLYLGLQVVFPIMSFMAIGFLIRRIGWFTETTFNQLNTFVFQLLMPILIITTIMAVPAAQLMSALNVQLLLFSLAGIAVMVLISGLLCHYKIRDKAARGVIIQGLYRSNLILYGVPAMLTIYDESKVGMISFLVIFIIPIYNIIAAVVLGRSGEAKISQRQMMGFVLRNPLVLGALLGILANVLLRSLLPVIVVDSLRQIGMLATPMAFLILGGTMKVKNFGKDLPLLALVCFVRLVLVPALALYLAITLLGLSGPALIVILGVFATPTAVNSYTMAKNMNIAPDLAGNLVVSSTLLSLFTLAGWITLLGALALL